MDDGAVDVEDTRLRISLELSDSVLDAGLAIGFGGVWLCTLLMAMGRDEET